MDNFCSKIYYFVVVFVLFEIDVTSSFPGQDCTEPCLSKMQMDLHGMDELSTGSAAMPWSQFLHNSKNKDVMESFFHKICTSYENVDTCLAECETRSRSGINIRQTYAGLKYICKDVKDDFFSALPCLADYEPIAMVKCQQQINQSHATTAQFTESIVNRELHSIRSRFRSLCNDLSNMIECMEPVIREGCGDAPTNMMLKFITLEFTSFEQLYGQLGFAEPLPSTCRNLLSMPQINNNQDKYEPLPNEIVFQQHSYSTHNSSPQSTSGILLFLLICHLLVSI